MKILPSYEARNIFDYPSGIRRKTMVSQRLPFIRRLYLDNIRGLHRLDDGKKTETAGYLENATLKFSFPVISKLTSKYGIELDGFNIFKFCAEPTGIDTGIVIVAPMNIDIPTGSPLSIKLIKIGIRGWNHVFFLTDFVPTTFETDVDDLGFRPMGLYQMMKSVTEVAPSMTVSADHDKHTLNSILSPFIGSDFLKFEADGIFSSYISDYAIEVDLQRIRDAIMNARYAIPLEHFGIENRLVGNKEDILSERKFTKKYRTVSLTLPVTQSDIIVESEFKWLQDDNMTYPGSERNLRNNTQFNQSLTYYALKNKWIPAEMYDKLLAKSNDFIQGMFEGGYKNIITSYLWKSDIQKQIGRISSYYLAFGLDFRDMWKLVKSTVANNLDEIIAGEKKLQGFNLPSTHQDYWEHIPRQLFAAVHESDRTKESIIEKMAEKQGKSIEKVTKIFEDAMKNGALFSPDGKRYFFPDESSYNIR